MIKNSICIILLISLVSACKNDMKDIKNLITRDQLNVEVGKDVEIVYSDSAVVRVRVQGPTMMRYLDATNPRQEFPNGVKVFFFDKDQKIQSVLTGKFAVRSESKRQTIVRDSIHWESTNLEQLETSELIWDEDKNIIYSNKFTKIIKPGEVAYGLGFKTNQEFTNWQITGIEGQFNAGDLSKQIEE